ncbi:hypothetical protein M9H77_19239 [Catharanthus roseus]|uniref:Uncharacterized protein n=1 Tax=Catharanthus roseus TaxID=4058 RepID=A0ACC0B9R8_CATRO|nr:hypothetical protein M9H77_19239 [Catharanthus roseus]
MFTGKRPTDNIFKDGLDLHNFVDKMNFPEQVMMITYPSLGEETRRVLEPGDHIVIRVNNNDRDLIESLVSIFRIGIKCSSTLPKDRMNMNEAVRELFHIKIALFGS